MRIDHLLALLNSVPLGDLPEFESPGRIKNLDKARAAIARLDTAPELHAALQSLLNSSIFGTTRDEFMLASSEYGELQAATARLIILISGLREALKSHASPGDERAIVIRLPDPNDFADALQILEQFRKAIEQVIVNEKIKGELKLLGWEIGSFWVDLYLGSPLAVIVIGSVAWAAAVVRKKIMEGSIIERKVKGLDIANEALQALQEGLKKEVDQLLDSESRAIYDKHFGTETVDEEQIKRIRFSIRMFSDLIGRGAEIHPSLYAPEEAKNVFPDIAKLSTIASHIQQLEDAAADES
jgi:hypothetical protein